MLTVGSSVPDVALRAHDGQWWRLSDALLRSRCAVLVFYLLDFSGV